jgi:glutamate-1-semialdehyde 2,1-aminomutase
VHAALHQKNHPVHPNILLLFFVFCIFKGMRLRTDEIVGRALRVIPGGVNSPVRAFGGLGLSPLVVERGAGDLIWDVDEREYIDYCGSWGALILGHAHPGVVKAASAQVAMGSSFGIATRVEMELAEKIVGLIPSIEKIRFVSSGTEATMTAMRIARGVTGRPKIVKFSGHYHGHSDALLVQAGSGVAYLNGGATSKGVNPGTIADTICLPFNDVDALRALFRSPLGKEVAALILEPVSGNMGVVLPQRSFLEIVREETARAGALLIFDEVITGFRVGLRGAQSLYGIDPDLTCLGKIIGGGFPAAAVGGKAKFMDALAPLGEVYQAGTLSGNPVAMQAGLAALHELTLPGFYEALEEKTAFLCRPIEKALAKAHKPACLQRVGSMLTLFWGVKKVDSRDDLRLLDQERFARFFRYLFNHGIYIPPASQEAWFISSAHTPEHLAKTSELICNFIQSEEGLFPPLHEAFALPAGTQK